MISDQVLVIMVIVMWLSIAYLRKHKKDSVNFLIFTTILITLEIIKHIAR